MRRLVVLLLGLALALPLTACASAADDADALWTALKGGGHVALLRHALAPGTGDPPGFRLEDCSTQRNLSAEGRAQAQRIGAALRARDIAIGQVWTSRWCRCRETAELLAVAPVEPWPALDSFFQEPARGPRQTGEVRQRISQPFTGPSRVLVTHQVNITALTDLVPASGELVVLRPDGDGRFTVLGRLKPE
jgi:phosphohistidine phosphatase SixA